MCQLCYWRAAWECEKLSGSLLGNAVPQKESQWACDGDGELSENRLYNW